MNDAAVRLPAAIVTLCDEHRYMSMLVDTLDEHLDNMKEPGAGDYFLMQDIVRYMHDYSDKVHHPTEDMMFDKLARRNPVREKDVARLRREHGFLDKNTSNLMKLLAVAADRQTAKDTDAVREAASTYIQRLRQHMQFEEQELFPSATRCLASKDWHDIEARLQAAQDPLFGESVQGDYRVLFEYFTDRSAQISRNMTNIGFLQLDNMIASADAIESGISEMWSLIQKHGVLLEKQFQAVAEKSAGDSRITTRLSQQAQYARVIGMTAVSAGSGAVGIYFRTLKNTAVSFFRGAP